VGSGGASGSSGVTVRAVVLSRFALDGGAMHGIVPRVLWERVHVADARHRIPLVARALVVDHAPSGSRTVIELGLGQRWTEKERDIYGLEPGPDAPEALRAAGVDPDTVTHVVLTHLHWDHAGGVVREDGSLAFPRAAHVVGEVCLGHALAPGEKDAGSFRAADLALLLREGRVRRWQEGEALAPGMTGRLSNGHTEGLVIPMVTARDDGPPLAVPTDLIPTRSHLRPGWVMAYDNLPAISVVEKRALIEELAAIGGGVLLYHDPEVEAAWATRGKKGAELVAGALAGPVG
jgi:glyoxylase-like metal-dependent hydrolase (beta-lactamase superfamily II)